MKRDHKKITYPAIASALSLVLLLIASVIPSGQLGFIAATTICSVFALSEAGLTGVVGIYVITSLLGFLLLPDRIPLILYLLFFGYYPILKAMTENLPGALAWLIKLLALNISLFLIKHLFSELILGLEMFDKYSALYYVICSAVFIIFDIGLSGVEEYFKRIAAQK